MAPPTTSTVPTFKARLVVVLDAALTVPVTYAWPGADTEAEAVFLGRHPDLVPNPLTESTRLSFDLSSIKAGRKHRTETYDVDLTIWSFRPELQPDDAATAESRAFEILEAVEDALANDPTLAVEGVSHAVIESAPYSLIPFQKGWAGVITPTITVTARLT